MYLREKLQFTNLIYIQDSMWEEYGNLRVVRVVNTGIYSIHDDGNKVIEDENGNEIVD